MTHVHCQCPCCRLERFLNRSWLGLTMAFLTLILLLLTMLFSLPGRARAAGEHEHVEPEPDKHGELEGTLGPRRSRYSAADVHAALAHASARTRCIVRVEVAGVGWNPYAVGAQGELGPGQLHPRGLLPTYLAETGGSPFDPYTVIPWIERMLQRGYASHWAGPRRGIC